MGIGLRCTTNSCRSSVEIIPSTCFSVVDKFTDGEGHDVRCKMLAALLQPKSSKNVNHVTEFTGDALITNTGNTGLY